MRLTSVVHRPGTSDHSEVAAEVLGANFGVSLNPYRRLVLQYTKLANYHGAMLCERWGGDYLEHRSQVRMYVGCLQFIEDMEEKAKATGHFWVSRLDKFQFWSPENVIVGQEMSDELGLPFEIYIGMGRGFLPLSQASKILCIEEAELFTIKLQLLMDDKTVEEALRRMLRPRSLWPDGETSAIVKRVKTK